MPMPRTVAVHKDVAGFQEQYGTLREATLTYLAGRMPEELARAFEQIVPPAFLSAVAQARLADVTLASLRGQA